MVGKFCWRVIYSGGFTYTFDVTNSWLIALPAGFIFGMAIIYLISKLIGIPFGEAIDENLNVGAMRASQYGMLREFISTVSPRLTSEHEELLRAIFDTDEEYNAATDQYEKGTEFFEYAHVFYRAVESKEKKDELCKGMYLILWDVLVSTDFGNIEQIDLEKTLRILREVTLELRLGKKSFEAAYVMYAEKLDNNLKSVLEGQLREI